MSDTDMIAEATTLILVTGLTVSETTELVALNTVQ